jgi:hypothetical protein
MRVAHMGDLGFRKGGGFRRGWGMGPGPWWYAGYEVEPPENKYVILDPTGKAIAVVRGIPKVPPGYSFRIATPAEAALNLPTTAPGLSSYIVRGPEGEMYGRYETMPPASKIPLYAMVEKEEGGWLGGADVF